MEIKQNSDTSFSRDYVRAVVERRAADADLRRPPRVMTKWWGEGLFEALGNRLCDFDGYCEDVAVVPFPQPAFEPTEDGFYWRLPPLRAEGTRGIDAVCRLPDWEGLEIMCKTLPDTEAPHLFDASVAAAKAARERGQYVLLHHWSLFFERIWTFRGMENLLTDYYDEPEKVHRLHKIVLDTELRLLHRAAREIQPDGYFISDDLGNQRSLMMSPKTFRTFIKPYYQTLWQTAHELGMHTWLHTCGNVTEIMDDLIECGLDVIHPLQKHTMNWEEIAGQYGGRITFTVGMDVQKTLRFGTPEEVRNEVTLIRSLFASPRGGLLLAAGNGITGGTPYENIAAFLDAARG